MQLPFVFRFEYEVWAWADAVRRQAAAVEDVATALTAFEWFLRRESSRALDR